MDRKQENDVKKEDSEMERERERERERESPGERERGGVEMGKREINRGRLNKK